MTATASELAEKIAGEMSIPADVPMTEEQAAEFRDRFEQAMRDGSLQTRIIPPRPLLTPETARALLRECVTVVKPGEVLAVRLPMNVGVHDMARARAYALEVEEQSGIKVAFLPGEEFAAIAQDSASGLPADRR